MKVHAVYFSPTGGTKKNVLNMARALAPEPAQIDLTPCSQDQSPIQFGRDDFVIAGSPCYKGRIPQAAAGRFARLRGDATPCVILVAYGNRDYDDSLLELHDLMAANGFLPQGAAALVARHTFGRIQVDRPDENDRRETEAFIRQLLERGDFTRRRNLQIKGMRPYRGEGTGAGFIPQTAATCDHCGLCARECPVGAIGEDCRSIDRALCLSCFRCIRICPQGAKNMDTPAYNEFAENFSKKLAARRENEFILE